MNKEANTLKEAVPIAMALIGFGYGIILFYFLEWDFSAPQDRVGLVRLMVIPIVVAALIMTFGWIKSFGVGDRENFKTWISNLFNGFAGGFELSLFLMAWSLLQQWLYQSETSYFEPMFVAVGVSIAVLEYFRRILGELE